MGSQRWVGCLELWEGLTGDGGADLGLLELGGRCPEPVASALRSHPAPQNHIAVGPSGVGAPFCPGGSGPPVAAIDKNSQHVGGPAVCLMTFCLGQGHLFPNTHWMMAPYPRGRAWHVAKLSDLSKAAQSCAAGAWVRRACPGGGSAIRS